MPEWHAIAEAPKDGTWLIGASWLRYKSGVSDEMECDPFPKIRLFWWNDGEDGTGWMWVDNDGVTELLDENDVPEVWMIFPEFQGEEPG